MSEPAAAPPAEQEPEKAPEEKEEEAEKEAEKEPEEPVSKSSPEAQAELKTVIEWIKDLCNADEATLLELFLDGDDSLDAELDREEMTKMLKEFDSNANDETINDYIKEIDNDNSGTVGFGEFCSWWAEAKDKGEGSGGSALMAATLKVRFLASKFSFGKTKFEKTMDTKDDDEVKAGVQAYTKCYQGLLDRKLERDVASLQKELSEKIEKAKEEEPWKGDEEKRFTAIFNLVTEGGQASVEDLGKIALYTGEEVSGKELECYRRIYAGKLDFPAFKQWWASRHARIGFW